MTDTAAPIVHDDLASFVAANADEERPGEFGIPYVFRDTLPVGVGGILRYTSGDGTEHTFTDEEAGDGYLLKMDFEGALRRLWAKRARSQQ